MLCGQFFGPFLFDPVQKYLVENPMTVVSVQHVLNPQWRKKELSDVLWLTTKAAFDAIGHAQHFNEYLDKYITTNWKTATSIPGPEHFLHGWLQQLNISYCFIPERYPVNFLSPSHSAVLPNGVRRPPYNFQNVTDIYPFVPSGA
jgi:hypothetical protein